MFDDKDKTESALEYFVTDIDKQRFDIVKAILCKASERNIRVSVFGGFGLDGLYGKMTRSHDDLDMFVEDDKYESLKSLLAEMGADLQEESSEKTVCVFPGIEDFKVEFARASVLREFTENDPTDFMPEEANASIDGVSLCTPNLTGQQEIIRIQTERAAENDWPYSQEKFANRDILIDVLRKKVTHEEQDGNN